MAGVVGAAAWVVAVVFPEIGASRLLQLAALAAVVIAAYGVWSAERQQLLACEDRFQDRPDLQIAPEGFYHDRRDFDIVVQNPLGANVAQPPMHMHVNVSMLHVRIINRARGVPTENAWARRVIARLHFFDAQNNELFFMDGRWSDTPQPPQLQAHQAAADELLAVDVPVGQIRELDIACKFLNSDAAYGFNNDSYVHGLMNPPWRLPTGDYQVRVHVLGTLVNTEWLLRFRVGGWGELLTVIP